MSIPQPPRPAKLVIGLLLGRKDPFPDVVAELEAAFGGPDLVSPWMPFGYTTYYEKEMGSGLLRRVLAFRTLIAQDRLAEIKLATNAMEQARAVGGRRRVNIDPGYLLQERFVLATGKNFSHRIYLGQGIYADLTLIYHHGEFQALPWTYPDYADRPLRRFLLAVRGKYARDVQAEFPEARIGGERLDD
jgi:Domain of unknown function (DUF4416)